MPRILIAGCGYVGRATASLFSAAGWEVEGWTASPESARELDEMPFPVRAVDITDRDAVSAACSAFDAIIQSVSTRGGGAEEYRKIYLGGGSNLRAVFPESLLLFTSSTSVYAQTEGEWVTEESPAEAESATARILRETEELILRANGIVARLAGIYGPARSALLRKFLDGTAVIDPGADRFINQVHRDDIAAALFLLAEKGLAGRPVSAADERRIFNVADGHPITRRECYAWLASHLNRPMPPTVPGEGERRRGRTNKRVSSAKLQALGWTPSFPTFQEAMSRSVLASFGV